MAGETPVAAPACGDGSCDPGEDCWGCAADCDCACGDGVCTYGEFCATCAADCDCDSLAATPPMGWNSWNRFACDIDEALALETAQAMVDSGLAAAGYRYVNLDDCWQVGRDAEGRVVVDPDRFPSGMKALGDKIHDLGLSFGTYTCAGTMTCEERPGSFGYELIDAETYADWGIDYVKVDWCFTEGMDARERYATMHDAIAAAGRPMIHSICNWGRDEPWIWGPSAGQLWRTSGDIAVFFPSVLVNLESTANLAPWAGPGRWNDPDMLEVGVSVETDAGPVSLTEDEQRAHLSLWSIVTSPLIMGHDLRTMSDETYAMLSNRHMIAVNQDPWALQGLRIRKEGGGEVWAKPLREQGLRAVVLFNRDPQARELGVDWSELGLAGDEAEVLNVWSAEDLGTVAGGLTRELPMHSAAMFIVRGQEPRPSAGTHQLSDLPWAWAANPRGPAERDQANGAAKANDGGPLVIGARSFDKGIGVQARSRVLIHLGGACDRMQADIGLDQSAGPDASVRFEVWTDGQRRYQSAVKTPVDACEAIDVDVSGARWLELLVDDTGDSAAGDSADWADARVHCK